MTPAPALALLLAAQPLTLDDALAEAATAGHDLRLAREDRARAAADVVGATAAVLPRLDLSAGFGRDFVGARRSVEVVPVLDPVTGAPAGFERRDVRTPASDAADYSLALRLDQTLWDFGGSWRRIAAARAGERAAARQLDEAGLATAFEVTRRFYEVVRADEALRVREETARRSEEVLRRAEALFEAGRAPRSEAISARVNLENDRIEVEAQRARAGQARADLALALGRSEGADELEVVPPASVTGAPAAEPEPAPVAALLAGARDRRPLLAARRALLAQAEAGRAAARAAYWPVLSAQASYTRAGLELAGSEGVYGDPTRQYVATAQLVLTWNLFSGRETTANERRAEADARRAAIEAERAEADVAADLARARAQAVAQSRSIGLAQAALAAAEDGVDAARARFDAGAADQLEVRDAELKLTQARLALLSARVDQAVARADLARAAGGPLP